MNTTNRTRLLVAATAAVLCFAGLTATAEEPKNNNPSEPSLAQPAPTKLVSSCTACLKADYVASLGTVDFLEGNKLFGSSCRFEDDFVVFSRKGSKEVIFIPKPAILYNQSEPPLTQSTPTMMSSCTACLKADYVASLGTVDFLEGNQLVGSSCRFENDFALFGRKGSAELKLIFIPKSAILYITGINRPFSF